MRMGLLVGWCLVVAGGGGSLLQVGRSAAGAAAAAHEARSRLVATTEQARELTELRARGPRERKPSAGLAPRISAALTHAGLPTSALASLSPESAFGEGANRRQRAVLALGAATLPQLGSFLLTWRAKEPDWVVSSIELSPQVGGPAIPGGDLPLRVVLAIEAVYVEQESPRSGGSR